MGYTIRDQIYENWRYLEKYDEIPDTLRHLLGIYCAQSEKEFLACDSENLRYIISKRIEALKFILSKEAINSDVLRLLKGL